MKAKRFLFFRRHGRNSYFGTDMRTCTSEIYLTRGKLKIDRDDIDRFFRIFTRKNHIWISGSLGIERVDLGRPDLWTRRTSYTLFFKSG
ncbi:hypothetical protein RCL_jg5303.t1 [Rhizophagus clarus]|uniref:Uncharacterized protein n=1 Tax=Rhizophagus clarus TaxID=94130 RepID=A0A8H3LNA6_9GLOM|nr:hypothetical protein RCL_jg5303.t1 [Rhizophagus clarus]